MNLAVPGQGAQQRVAVGNVAVNEYQQRAGRQLRNGLGQGVPSGAAAGGRLPASAASAAATPVPAAAAPVAAAGAFLRPQGPLNLYQPDSVQKRQRLADCQRLLRPRLRRRHPVPVGVNQVGRPGVPLDAPQRLRRQKGVAINDVCRHIPPPGIIIMRRRGATAGGVQFSTSSVSTPNTERGCTKAIVPDRPCRGSWSISDSPLAESIRSLSPMSSTFSAR